MAKIPIVQAPGPINTGIRTARVPQFQADTSGIQIGEAIKGATDVAVGMMVERQKANDALGMMDVEREFGELQKQQDDFQRKNPNQEDWSKHWSDITTEYRDKLSKKELSRDARLITTRNFERFNLAEQRRIEDRAYAQAKDRLYTGIRTRIQMAETPEEIEGLRTFAGKGGMLPEDFDAVALPAQKALGQRNDKMLSNSILKEKGSAGVKEADAVINNSPYFSKLEKRELTAGNAYAGEFEDLKVMSYNDPFRAIELAQVLRGPERIEVEKRAESRIQEVRGANLKSYKEDVEMGKVPNWDTLKNDPYLSDFDRKAVSDYALQGPMNDPAGYAQLMAEAANFKGDKSSPEYAVISQRINMALSDDLRSNALSQLSRAAEGGEPDSMTRSQNEVFGLAADDMRAGRFGTWEVPLTEAKTLPQDVRSKVDAIKETLAKERGMIWKEAKTSDELEKEAREAYYTQESGTSRNRPTIERFTVVDEDLKAAANRRYQDVLMSLEKWKNDNPKATPQELRSHYDRLTARFRASAPNELLPSIDARANAQDIIPNISDILQKHGKNP